MTEINRDFRRVDYSNNNSSSQVKTEKKDIKLEDISVLYSTEKLEEDRTSFEETFEKKSLDEASDGKKFLNSLIENKDELSNKLGLTSEQYDSFACVALALASQETGMGFEKDYVDENTGWGKTWRDFKKNVHVKLFGGGSASSGLTQMKIHDFMNANKLTDSEVQLLKDLGIESTGINDNNLYSQPDKAAIATMVVLNSIANKYGDYENVLREGHESVAGNINDELSPEERVEKGIQLLDSISAVYQNATDEEKVNLRETFKDWLISEGGTKSWQIWVDSDINEEKNLNKLNKLIKKEGSDLKLSQSDLNYIRYALTDEGQEMTMTEFLAYGWNKGTGTSGMALDRIIADKIGIILSNPEDFDYDQFTVNVSTLAEMYAEQSIEIDGKYAVNSGFFDIA